MMKQTHLLHPRSRGVDNVCYYADLGFFVALLLFGSGGGTGATFCAGVATALVSIPSVPFPFLESPPGVSFLPYCGDVLDNVHVDTFGRALGIIPSIPASLSNCWSSSWSGVTNMSTWKLSVWNQQGGGNFSS